MEEGNAEIPLRAPGRASLPLGNGALATIYLEVLRSLPAGWLVLQIEGEQLVTQNGTVPTLDRAGALPQLLIPPQPPCVHAPAPNSYYDERCYLRVGARSLGEIFFL
ncbi:MAG: hypothetical protein ACUVWA_12990 [Candidatus Oleimicrobiaceae bacterium]